MHLFLLTLVSIAFTSVSNQETSSFVTSSIAAPTTSVYPACTVYPYLLTGYNGTFGSPNYPNYYPNNANCAWRITSTLQVVILDFLTFATEPNRDYVFIYDDYGDTVRSMAYFSSAPKPPPTGIATTQIYMYIKFTSDFQTVRPGFEAKFTSSDDLYAGQCPPDVIELKNPSGKLSSPRYPYSYPRTVCRWLISSVFEIVQLEFLHLYTNPTDYVRLFDSSSETALIVELSSFLNPPFSYWSTQKYMFVTFTSDVHMGYTGFSTNYHSLGTACSPTHRPLLLQGSTGTISSPNFPGEYVNDTDCQWLIESSYEFGFVRLDFQYFYTETCCDVVYIYDGGSLNEALIVTLSGAYSELPGNYISTQRHMYIRFKANGRYSAGGFLATFESVDKDSANTY